MKGIERIIREVKNASIEGRWVDSDKSMLVDEIERLQDVVENWREMVGAKVFNEEIIKSQREKIERLQEENKNIRVAVNLFLDEWDDGGPSCEAIRAALGESE